MYLAAVMKTHLWNPLGILHGHKTGYSITCFTTHGISVVNTSSTKKNPQNMTHRISPPKERLRLLSIEFLTWWRFICCPIAIMFSMMINKTTKRTEATICHILISCLCFFIISVHKVFINAVLIVNEALFSTTTQNVFLRSYACAVASFVCQSQFVTGKHKTDK